MKTPILCLTLAAVLLWGCGKKGPLVLEPQKLPPAVEKLELRQIGSGIELSWKYPALQADGKTPWQAELLRNVYVHHLAKPSAADTFLKRSEVLAKPRGGDVRLRPDGVAVYSVSLPDKLLQDREHAFAVGYTIGRTRSALSAIQKITTRTPPKPISDLKIGRQGKVVILDWSRPQVDSAGRPLPALAGYRVYRRIQPAVAEAKGAPEPAAAAPLPGAFAALTAKAVPGEHFEDNDTGVDGEYEYAVATVLDERSESAPSNAARVHVVDTYPPDVPASLVAFSAKDHVFLTWEAVADRDLDHYVVYRRLADEEDFKILDAAVRENLYRDRRAAKGRQYAYAVAAVDRKGNESEASRPALHKYE